MTTIIKSKMEHECNECGEKIPLGAYFCMYSEDNPYVHLECYFEVIDEGMEEYSISFRGE